MWGNNADSSFSGTQGFMKPRESPGLNNSQTEKRKFRTQTIVPVTIGHIHETMKHSEAFKIGDMEINMVSVVGIIVSVEQKTTHIVYVIDDMTGPPITFQHWIDDTNDRLVSDKRPMVENTYVQVHGSVKKMRDQLNIIVFKIKTVINLNCLTLHLLEVINSRKMLEVKIERMRNQKLTGDDGNGISEMQNSSSTDVNMDTKGAGIPEGLSKIQAMIYKTVQNCKQVSGCTVEWLREQLNSVNSSTMSEALNFLCDEGHIYTTIDDSHFKVTDTS